MHVNARTLHTGHPYRVTEPNASRCDRGGAPSRPTEAPEMLNQQLENGRAGVHTVIGRTIDIDID
jgi:hypothetical protein